MRLFLDNSGSSLPPSSRSLTEHQRLELIDLGSQAGYYGGLAIVGIYDQHTPDTIALWARLAARYALQAFRKAGVTYD